MNVLRAEAMGLCFGVRDALRIADSVADPSSVTIHGELVHNERILVQLQSRGFQSTGEANRSDVPATARVLVTAHGISDRERRRLEMAGKELIDTTCPLVRRVHRAARALEDDGHHVLIIGKRNHVEVLGVIEDLKSVEVIEAPGEVRTYAFQKLGIVCQTTAPPALADEIREAIRSQNRSAEMRFIDTICQPTRDRQEAVDRLVRRVDGIVVVGGKNSNNTRQLVERCRTARLPVFHVQSAADLDPAWFHSIETVGLTAGTSALDETIEEVYEALRQLSPGIPASSRQWLNHFRRNADAQAEIPWSDPRRLSAAERVAVGRSVQIFQLGESGGGSRLLRAAEKYARRFGDAEYVDALRLFVKEEQRHAALLERFLLLEQIGTIQKQWTNGIFRALRDLVSLEVMLSVLLAAEVIAKVYYAVLRRATKSEILRAICTQILRDEAWHVRFQCQRLALMCSRHNYGLRKLTTWAQSVLFACTALVVWLTHRRAFLAGGMHYSDYRRKVRREFAQAIQLIDSVPSCRAKRFAGISIQQARS